MSAKENVTKASSPSAKKGASKKPAVAKKKVTVAPTGAVGAGAPTAAAPTAAGAAGAVAKTTLKMRPSPLSSAAKKARGAVTTKTVVVKKRTIKPVAAKTSLKRTPARSAKSAAEGLEKKAQSVEENRRNRKKPPLKALPPGGMVLRVLTEEEKKRRGDALNREQLREKEAAERAKLAEASRKEQEEVESKRLEEEKARDTAKNLLQQRRQEEDARHRAEADTSQHADKTTDKRKPPVRATSSGERRQRKLRIHEILNDNEKQQSLSALRRRMEKQKAKTRQPIEKIHIVRDVIIPESIDVASLADRMAVRTHDVIKFLTKQDIVVKASDALDADTAQLVVEEFGHKVKRVAESDVEEAIDGRKDAATDLLPRPPVVTVMGHVDHGKTSLLDALRSTSIAAREAGGITQHIGAYQTALKGGRTITFIDTPGHAAFTAMRSRGAKTTDIIVLVIAADDSVMPQTIESISHAKAANTPMIVALNKMDLPGADENKITQQLLQYEVMCEAMGGEVQVVPLSAKTGEGLDALSEAIAIQADIMELQANPNRPAQGVVVEARLDKGAGHVATILVQRGTLKKGDVFVSGTQWGKVRRMMAFDGSPLSAASPSCPVALTGLNGPVLAGDRFDCVETESRAREIAEYRKRQRLSSAREPGEGKSMDELLANAMLREKPELYYIVKTDVQGSADAIKQALENTSTDEITVKVSHAGVGEVNASDVMLAETVGGKVLMFNIKANAEAQKASKSAKIALHQFDVIYALIDEVKTQAAKLLGPQRKEIPLGSAQVLQLFSVGKKNVAAGCRIDEGQVKKNAHIRIKREDVIIHEGMIQSLRHFKENVAQVEAGKECGIVLDSAPKLKEGDVIQCFQVEQVERTID